MSTVELDCNQNSLPLTTAAGAVGSERLTEDETLALAQFVKRVGWFEFSSNTANDDEAHLVKQAIDKLQDVLTRSGYAAR